MMTRITKETNKERKIGLPFSLDPVCLCMATSCAGI